MRAINLAALVGLAMLFLGTAHAQGARWTVIGHHGDVIVNGKEIPPAGAPSFASGWVATGDDSSVTLARGEQRIDLGANARISIANRDSLYYTEVHQTSGLARYVVDKRDTKHFEVRTDHLAAVVKGTAFAVDATSEIHTVAVSSGLVEVTANDSGAVSLVGAGQSASAGAAPPRSAPDRADPPTAKIDEPVAAVPDAQTLPADGSVPPASADPEAPPAQRTFPPRREARHGTHEQ